MVRFKPDSRACTAFISPFVTFQYIRMQFGLANAAFISPFVTFQYIRIS